MSGTEYAPTDAQSVIDTATRAAGATSLDHEDRLHAFVVPDGGSVEIIDVEEHLEKFRDAPRRKEGTYRVHDPESLLAYLEKHGDTDSEVWADVVGAKITAVLDAHRTYEVEAGDNQFPRFEGHRVVYEVKKTDAWLAWAAHDGKLLDQTTFAEHIEDRAVDVVVPTGADMLELAQSIQATLGGSFESTKRLSNGERQIEYREKVEATAGKKGALAVPEKFELALQPFEGAEVFRVTARLRLRINGGELRMGYKLERPADLLREAFLSVVKVVDEGTGPDLFVFRGVR